MPPEVPPMIYFVVTVMIPASHWVPELSFVNDF